MKVLLLGGPAHGEEREVAGEPSHVVWAALPPVRVITDGEVPRTADRPKEALYVPVKFGRPDTMQTRLAYVYEPERHLVDRLLNSYLRCRWIAEGDEAGGGRSRTG